MDPVQVGARVGMLVAFVLAGWVLNAWTPRPRKLIQAVRERLLFGLPLGTLLSAGVVAGFFCFVQGWWGHDATLTLPFTSWSLRYPLGMALAPIAHQSLGHLVGNLAGFLVFGTIAEYVVGHFPHARGSTAFDRPRTNPYFRALVLVPAVVFGVALLTSVFAWGPIIGFSGVVYATVGFVLVRYPLLAVVGLAGREFVMTALWAFRRPILTGSAGSSYGTPWWADVAVQTHLLGLLIGAGLSVWVLSHRREEGASAGRLFVGTLLVGGSLTLWALWWYTGPESYRLYRGPGIVLIVAVALLVTVAARIETAPLRDLRARQFAVGLLVVPVLVMGGVAMPINLTTGQADVATPGPTVAVEGYEIGYGESVPDTRFEPINVTGLPSPDPPTASGVIVANEARHLWTAGVGAGELENSGQRTLTVGGLTWREQVTVRRVGWQAVGGDSAFVVRAAGPDGRITPLYASDTATSRAVIEDHRISVRPENGSFLLEATPVENASIEGLPATTPVPAAGNETGLGTLTVERAEGTIWIRGNGTRVPAFRAENK
ncbi:MAG: rhomboid family intramembrane serine protease [Halodesulfurarchaeum sp.]